MPEIPPVHVLNVSKIFGDPNQFSDFFIKMMAVLQSENIELDIKKAIMSPNNPDHFNFYCELSVGARNRIKDIFPSKLSWVE